MSKRNAWRNYLPTGLIILRHVMAYPVAVYATTVFCIRLPELRFIIEEGVLVTEEAANDMADYGPDLQQRTMTSQ